MSCGKRCGNRPKGRRASRFRRFLLGAYRVGLLVAAFAAVAVNWEREEGVDEAALLELARAEISEAMALGAAEEGFFPVLDAGGEVFGWATTSFPQAREIYGYAGASEVFILLDAGKKVRSVRFLRSDDTSGHVSKVRGDSGFW